MDDYRSDTDMLEVEDLLLPSIFAAEPNHASQTNSEKPDSLAVAKLKEDTEKFFEIMTAVMYGHLTKGRDLMARMKLLKERISAGIAEFRAEMARLKIIQIRLQLLAEAGRASADEDHPISAADRKAAVAAVEELLDELIELEEGLRKQTETRETEGLQERLEEITAAMSKVVQALLL